jgi:hypothetical protein
MIQEKSLYITRIMGNVAGGVNTFEKNPIRSPEILGINQTTK